MRRRLFLITPIRDTYDVDAYEAEVGIASPGKKSSAVTAPSVTSRMRHKCSIRGMRWPAMYRLTATWLTPMADAKSARDMERASRKSASFIPDPYQAGTKKQEDCTNLVWDNSDALQYHFGMNAMQRARVAKGLSRKQLADKLGLSETSVGRFEQGSRPMSDAWASKIAAILEVSPLELKPDFAKHVIAGLSPRNRQKFFDNLETLFVVESVEKRRASS